MIISLKLKKRENILNLLFLFLPINFLLPVSYSNMFCIIYLFTTFFFFKKYNLNFKKDILDLVIFFFFCIIITSSLREILILNDFKKEDLIVKIFNKISVIRFFFIYWLTKNILQYNLVKIENFFKISLYCVIFVSINILLMHLIGNDIFGNKEFANRFSTIFGERAVAGTYLLNFFFFGLVFFFFVFKKVFL